MEKKKSKSKKEPTAFFTKIFVRIITVILLVFLFAGAAYFVTKKLVQVESENKKALVDKQLDFCQELVSAKYKYSDIITLKKSAGLAKSYSIVKYSGIIRAGIGDVSSIKYTISKNGDKIEIVLPAAEILGNELLKQEVFDEKQSIFVPITTQEIFDEIEEARKQAQEDMIADGILTEAFDHAKKVINQIMLTSGFEEVIVR